jgi:Protein of unknown function (DUF2970)
VSVGDVPSGSAGKSSFMHTLRTVAWSFFGVRRRKDHERETAKLNPVHVIAAGVLGAALFVLVLVLLVNWIVGSGAMR